MRMCASERSWCLFPTNINRPECAFLFITLRLRWIISHFYFILRSSRFDFSFHHPRGVYTMRNYWNAFHWGNQWAARKLPLQFYYGPKLNRISSSEMSAPLKNHIPIFMLNVCVYFARAMWFLWQNIMFMFNVYGDLIFEIKNNENINYISFI